MEGNIAPDLFIHLFVTRGSGAASMVACEVQQVRISYRYWLGLSILRGILWLHSFENTKISLGIVLPAKGEKYEAKLSPLITTWLELALAVHPQPEAKGDSIFLLSPNGPMGDIRGFGWVLFRKLAPPVSRSLNCLWETFQNKQ